MKETYRRSRKIALHTVFFGQVPLMFIVLNVSDVASVESAVIGMAILTMVLVGVVFHGGFLYYSRPHADG